MGLCLGARASHRSQSPQNKYKMVFWTLVSLFRGSPIIGESTRQMSEKQRSNATNGGSNTVSPYSRVSFERRSVYAFSIVSANTNRNRMRRKSWVEPCIVPTVEIFTKIMEFLPPRDSAKLLGLCQLWSGPAAEALYASPTFRTSRSFPALISLLLNQDTIHPYALLIREFCFAGEAAQEIEMGDLKQALQACTNLVSLRIEGCSHLSSLLARFLKEHAPFLSRVEFPACHVSDSFLQQLIRGVKNLRHIDVSYTSVSLSQLAVLARECPSLETLCMAGCLQSPEEDIFDYEASEYYLVGDSLKKHRASSLMEVDVSNSLINDAIVGYLARHSHNLESIIMDGCSLITDSSINSIAMHCPNLKLLNLSYCHITDLALQYLAIHLSSGLSTSPLEADDDSISAERTKSYSSFSEYEPPRRLSPRTGPLLEVIVLTGCKHITQAGIKFLALKCPNLDTIVLDGCHKVTDWYFGAQSDIITDSVESPDTTAVSEKSLRKSSVSTFSHGSDDTESFISAKSELEMSPSDAMPSLRKLSLNRKQILEKQHE